MYLFRLRFLTLIILCLLPLSGHAADHDIRLNGLGYLPDRVKQVSVANRDAETLQVKRAEDDEVVFETDLTESMVDPWTNAFVFIADFTALSEPGVYYIDVPEVGVSKPFPISEDVYDAPLKTAMLGMYGMRSGVDIALSHGGEEFSHAAGHLEDGYLDYWGEPEVLRDAVGGWYDAGDYGKYVNNGAFAAGMMLSAFEMFPEVLSQIELPIPESDNDVPDFLDEIRYELEWLFKMQMDDGRVSHKLSAIRFGGFVLPEEHTVKRFFAPYDSAATADLVAVMAKAARVFAPYDADFSDRCLAAAELSWGYLTDNPEYVYYGDIIPDGLQGFSTGQYRTLDGDDKLWASVELWETTGDTDAIAQYENIAEGNNAFISGDSFDWDNVKNLGTFVYLLSAREGRNPEIVASLESQIIDEAAMIIANAEDSGFGRGRRAFFWGSNGLVVRHCMTLFAAHRIDPDESYLDTCVQQLDYLYGRNFYGRSQVTGEGLFPPCNIHDRRSGGDDVVRPYPGLLVGGGSTATNWVDVASSYETNEIAINWQGALIFGLAGFATGGNEESAVGFEPTFDQCDVEPPVVEVEDPNQSTGDDTDTAASDDGDVGADGGDSQEEKEVSSKESGCGCGALGRPRSGLLILALLRAVF